MISTRLKWAEVLKRIKKGYPFSEPFHGNPKCLLSVGPQGREIIFKIRKQDKLSASNKHTKIQIMEARSGKEIHIKCQDKALFGAFYEICNVIADAVQSKKLRPLQAISESLSKFENILEKQKLPKSEAVIGILGELYFFNELLKKYKPSEAFQYWTGIEFEEHDFSCAEIDIEVKTTLKDERTHRITSINQLTPKPHRELMLISLMITPGAGKGSFSVVELINKISKETNEKPLIENIKRKINIILNDSLNSESCKRKFTLRKDPCCYPVDYEFPQITRKILGKRNHHISDVSYNIHLDGYNEKKAKFEYDKLLKNI
jgi:hypothetical protein